jgi:hypothetical protein
MTILELFAFNVKISRIFRASPKQIRPLARADQKRDVNTIWGDTTFGFRQFHYS